MKHFADIRFIYPHAESNSSNHNRGTTRHKPVLDLVSQFIFHSGMVSAGVNSRVLQGRGNIFSGFLESNVNNDGNPAGRSSVLRSALRF